MRGALCPRKRSINHDGPSQGEGPGGPGGEGGRAMSYRIVAADDNPVVAELIRTVLSQAGFEVEMAPAGGEALLALQRNPPDLFLLDLQMPGLDGLEVL